MGVDDDCPADEALRQFGLGTMSGPAAERVGRHVERCTQCRGKLAAGSGDGVAGKLKPSHNGKVRANGSGAAAATAAARARVTARPEPKKVPIVGLRALPKVLNLPRELAEHPDYEIKKEIARGGMGAVYLAHNRLLGRDEALKVIGRSIVESPEAYERFVREIRAVARLQHPNIVTAYSAFRLGGSVVFAMEYVEGFDLARLVKNRGPFPVAHACNFAHQAALGMQHAHEEGIIHRDIKPGNLILTRRGDRPLVQILDFGLAKATHPFPLDGSLTGQGQALGTPDYIAPEQIVDAQHADIRSDIYSLGGTLYYLLSGRTPFWEKSVYDLYQAHISREPDALNLIRPEVPAELAALIGKMMAKNPDERFQTPNEVARALEPFFKKNRPPHEGGHEPSQISASAQSTATESTADSNHAPAHAGGIAETPAQSSLSAPPVEDQPKLPSPPVEKHLPALPAPEGKTSRPSPSLPVLFDPFDGLRQTMRSGEFEATARADGSRRRRWLVLAAAGMIGLGLLALLAIVLLRVESPVGTL